MPNSFTANLNLEKPEVGADSNLWGGHLNSDLDILDSIFTSATTRPQSTIIKSDTKWVDATTTTKGILFSLSGINTTTTRSIVWKDSDGTVALMADIATATTGMATTGTVTTAVAAATVGMVDTSSVQTLSNKMINSPAINTATISGASTGVTQAASDNSTKLATTAYVDRASPPTTGTSWTPADGSGVGLIFTNVAGNYVQIGNLIFAHFTLTFPATADGTQVLISGLPVAAANADRVQIPSLVRAIGGSTTIMAVPIKNTTTFNLFVNNAAFGNNSAATLTFRGMIIYPVN